jgi:hypothetical protein
MLDDGSFPCCLPCSSVPLCFPNSVPRHRLPRNLRVCLKKGRAKRPWKAGAWRRVCTHEVMAFTPTSRCGRLVRCSDLLISSKLFRKTCNSSSPNSFAIHDPPRQYHCSPSWSEARCGPLRDSRATKAARKCASDNRRRPVPTMSLCSLVRFMRLREPPPRLCHGWGANWGSNPPKINVRFLDCRPAATGRFESFILSAFRRWSGAIENRATSDNCYYQ